MSAYDFGGGGGFPAPGGGGGYPSPDEQEPTPEPDEQGGDYDGLMEQSLSLLRQAREMAPEMDDAVAIEKSTTLLTQALATAAKAQDAAMGVTPAHKYVRRQRAA